MKTKLGEGSTLGQPWKVRASRSLEETPTYYDIVFSDGEHYSIVARCHNEWLSDEHKGAALNHALLIAKAPLLVEAKDVLENLIIAYEQDSPDHQKPVPTELVKARALLAKLEEE